MFFNTKYSNLECFRSDVFDYEFYEFSNFTNLECSYYYSKNTPN